MSPVVTFPARVRRWSLGLALVLSLACLDSFAQTPTLSDAYIPADAFAAIVVQPQAAMTSKDLDFLPREVFTASSLMKGGFDLAQVAQLTVVVEDIFASRRPPGGAFVLKFAKPFDQTKIFPDLCKDATRATANGKTYLKPQRPEILCVSLIDDKTVLLAVEPLMLKMLAAPANGTGVLHTKLRAADPSAHAVAVVSVEAVRNSLKEVTGRFAGQLPPPLADLLTVPDLTSAVELKVVLAPNVRISANFHAVNAMGAPEIEKKLLGAKQFGRQLVEAQITQTYGENTDPLEKAFGQYRRRLVKYADDELKIKATGSQVSVTCELPIDLSAGGLLTLFMPASARAMR